MSVLQIVKAPNPILSKASLHIDVIDGYIKNLADDMLKTMYAVHGVGLSAVQVGVLKRLIVVDVDYRIENDEIVSYGNQYIMINPEITEHSSEMNSYSEGCLSFPDENVLIERPKEILVSYTDLNGVQQKLKADGLLATCIQHECDHMNGITIDRYLTHLKREMMLKRLLKRRKNGDF